MGTVKVKDEEGKDIEFTLTDYEEALIRSLQDLTREIRRLIKIG